MKHFHQCEAMLRSNLTAMGHRCTNEATVETKEGDLYCDEHKDWNDE
jgi:hypothetical protein